MATFVTGLTDTSISDQAADRIQHHKLFHEKSISREQVPSTAVVAYTGDIHIAQGSGTLRKFTAAITGTIATGADRTVTIDLHKGNTANAFATVLATTIGFTNGSSLRTPVNGAFSNSSYSAGDILRFVITVAGAAGNQALGLVVTLILSENPTLS